MNDQEADPQLLDSFRDLEAEMKELRLGVASLAQAVDELRGEIMERWPERQSG